jgi:hypothetical protein
METHVSNILSNKNNFFKTSKQQILHMKIKSDFFCITDLNVQMLTIVYMNIFFYRSITRWRNANNATNARRTR